MMLKAKSFFSAYDPSAVRRKSLPETTEKTVMVAAHDRPAGMKRAIFHSKKTALLEVREVANEYGWHLFGYRILYSRRIPKRRERLLATRSVGDRRRFWRNRVRSTWRLYASTTGSGSNSVPPDRRTAAAGLVRMPDTEGDYDSVTAASRVSPSRRNVTVTWSPRR